MANKEIKDFANTTTPAGTDKILIQNAAGTTEYQTRTQLNKLFGTEVFDTDSSVKMAFQIGGTEKMRLNTNGDLLIGTTTSPTGTVGKTICFGDNTGDPTMGSNICAIYGKDVSGTVEVHVIDEAGNVTKISPHDPVTGEWVFESHNVKTGRRLRVSMEKLVRAMDAMLGGGFIEEE